jgi:hypothetical protein
LQRLGSILAQIKLPGPGPLQMRQIEAALQAELSPKASGLRAASYRRGRLVVETKSAARAFEQQAFARSGLVARLKKHPGLEQLTEIVFKPGAWRAHGRQ